MDVIDKKLLSALAEDARTPFTRLAKRARVSREVATYRVNRLVRQGVIRKFITRIDLAALGHHEAALFLTLKHGREEAFRDFISRSKYISWVGEWTGVWSFALSITGRTNEEIEARFHDLFSRFREDLIAHRFVFHKRTRFFTEKLFGSESTPPHSPKLTVKIDDVDKKLLRVLAEDARADYVALAKHSSLTAPAIRQRIKRLEKAGVIQSYSLFLDFRKLGLQHYSVFVTTNDVETKRFVEHLALQNKVSFVAEYLGDPFLEFGVFVENPYQLREILRGLEASFPEYRIFELSLFEETLVSAGPPRCVFD